MDFIKFPDLLIRFPDGGKTGGLCGHYINTDPEVRTQLLHARSHKFHDLIIHIAVCKGRPDNGKRHVLRTYAFHRLAIQIDTYYLRHFDIIRLVQQLFYQLRAAFSHSHGTQSSIAGVAVGSQDHLSAA